MNGLFASTQRFVLLLPVISLALDVAIFGHFAAQRFDQHSTAMKANAALRFVLWPVLELATGVTIPGARAQGHVSMSSETVLQKVAHAHKMTPRQ